MIDLGELKLRDDIDTFDTYYVAVLNTHVMATTDLYDLRYYDTIGKIKVYHSGFYPGPPEALWQWLERSVTDHVIAQGWVVPDGETGAGEQLWAWKGGKYE